MDLIHREGFSGMSINQKVKLQTKIQKMSLEVNKLQVALRISGIRFLLICEFSQIVHTCIKRKR